MRDSRFASVVNSAVSPRSSTSSRRARLPAIGAVTADTHEAVVLDFDGAENAFQQLNDNLTVASMHRVWLKAEGVRRGAPNPDGLLQRYVVENSTIALDHHNTEVRSLNCYTLLLLFCSEVVMS